MLVVRDVAVSGDRSLRRIGFPVDDLSVFVGGNGTGKTQPLSGARIAPGGRPRHPDRDLAAEGGMELAL